MREQNTDVCDGGPAAKGGGGLGTMLDYGVHSLRSHNKRTASINQSKHVILYIIYIYININKSGAVINFLALRLVTVRLTHRLPALPSSFCNALLMCSG